MRGRRLWAGLAALVLPAALAGCGSRVVASTPLDAGHEAYPVGVRVLMLSRGSDRPLPTTIWYPAAGIVVPGGGPGVPIRNALVAPGRFPIVLFSHGLDSRPEFHAQLTARWAATGFVVVAPAYPHTKLGAERFDRQDLRRQPADAQHVLRVVASLDAKPDDPLAGHLDADRVAAVGHSAGGFTTAGLFVAGHSQNLRGGIVIAGGMRDIYGGPPAAMLFVHGAADRVVPVAKGRSAYERVPWPKALLTVIGQGHGEYLIPGQPGFDPAMATMTDFLLWVLLDDVAARDRLPLDADVPGVTTWLAQI